MFPKRKRRRKKDGKTATSGKKSARPASDAPPPVSAQKICAVRKTATEERVVVRKTPDLDIFPSVSQQAIFRGKVGHDLENRGENAMIPALTQVPSTLKNAGVAVAQTRVWKLCFLPF